jgi:hypothetical protein
MLFNSRMAKFQHFIQKPERLMTTLHRDRLSAEYIAAIYTGQNENNITVIGKEEHAIAGCKRAFGEVIGKTT